MYNMPLSLVVTRANPSSHEATVPALPRHEFAEIELIEILVDLTRSFSHVLMHVRSERRLWSCQNVRSTSCQANTCGRYIVFSL